MLEGLVIGWQEIEPVFLVNVALNKPFILLGKHGTCKTTCAKEIAKIYGKKSFRFYDATKDDLISIAGIPIPQKLAKGRLEFSEHDRSIWHAKVIVIDELTRANRENQNLWLEILEEKTCFGKKLGYEVLIATMNPESYAATFKLDEALLDRFYAVIPVPDLQKGTTSEVFKQVIQLNLKEQNLNIKETKRLIEKIRKTYNALVNNKDIIDAINEYVSNYIEILLKKIECYISPRKAIHLVEEILGLGAYFLTQNKEDFLNSAAQKVLIHVLGIPFKIKPEVLMQIHSNLKPILSKKTLENAEKTRIDLAKLPDHGAVIKYVRENITSILKHLPFDESDKLLVQIIEQSKDEDLLRLRDILDKVNGHEEQKRVVEARILFQEIRAVDEIHDWLRQYEILNDQDFEVFDRAKVFVNKLKKFPWDKKIERLVFKKGFDKNDMTSFIRKGGFDGDKTEAGSGVQRSGPESD